MDSVGHCSLMPLERVLREYNEDLSFFLFAKWQLLHHENQTAHRHFSGNKTTKNE